ncbi:MAG: hypothetical protein ABI977_12210 [Acidobacteriota bacterium]
MRTFRVILLFAYVILDGLTRKHKQQQIEKELAKGWDYAQKYEELQAQFLRVNQLLKEDGSQIDDRQEFGALDQDAFRNCEPRVEDSIQSPEEISTHLEIAPVSVASTEATVNSTPSAIFEEKGTQPEEKPVIIEEQSRRHITPDDLRSQTPQKNRRHPSSAPRTEQPGQLSLWQ